MSSKSSKSAKTDNETLNKKIAKCLRQVANITTVKPAMLLDTKAFNPKLLKSFLPTAAPKISKLLDKIAALDAKDKQKDGTLYKHVIFTDVLNGKFGAKMVASAFISHGYEPLWNGLKLKLRTEDELLATKNKNFGLLLSKPFAKATMPVKFKKAEAQLFNSRPDNVHGKLVRFMILDQGFKEGIDMFDVKYIHILEPLVSAADETQVIGRGTRLCGQKGLTFHPKFGWPLYVFRYDVDITAANFDAKTMFELFMKYNGVDLRRLVFASELDKIVVESAVDKPLTEEVHLFQVDKPSPISGGGAESTPPTRKLSLQRMHTYISNYFTKFKYPKVKLENMCVEKQNGSAGWSRVSYTPTQDFVRHFFQPISPYKGILLYHSVGTGKLCSGIAAASSSFEKEGYTILWVTRHTLKADVWKNMFGMVCSQTVLDRVDKGTLKLPIKGSPARYLSKQWIEPISYKQFSNMLLQKNKYYDELVERNGKTDPLHKTLVVIDEAHKLYAENVSKAEKPNIDILEKMIQDSFNKSGKDSVRVILMTATPYTNDGMEMIKLLNLIREDPLPADFEGFTEAYLQTDGKFSAKGKTKFQNDISGYVSYLNRSQDARTFAHPVIQNILVDMSMDDGQRAKASKHLDQQIKDIAEQVKNLRADLKSVGCDEPKPDIKGCKEKVGVEYERTIQAAKKAKEDGTNDCNTRPVRDRKECKATVTMQYKNATESAKASKAKDLEACKELKSKKSCTGKKDEIKARIAQLLLEKAELKERIKAVLTQGKANKETLKELREEQQNLKPDLKLRIDKAKELRKQLKDLKEDPNPDKQRIEKLKAELKEAAEKAKETKAEYDSNRMQMTKLKSDQKADRLDIGRAALGKVSQQQMITKCLNKTISDSDSGEDDDEDEE
jgi:hypothetical protein